jgi:hypothetical protein
MKMKLNRHHDQVTYYRSLFPEGDTFLGVLEVSIVVVVGVGGLGSELIRHLACAGVSTIVCIDYDTVEPSNLNRQMWFTETDVGRDKVLCVQAVLASFAPATKIIPVKARIQNAKQLQHLLKSVISDSRCSFLACCADEPIGGIEKACAIAAIDLSCPLGFAGMNLRRGYWGVASTATSQRHAVKLFDQVSHIATACNQTVVQGSSSWTNALIAAFFAEAVVETLTRARSTHDGVVAFDFEKMCAASTFHFEH